ncbi:MAG: class I SAM-dependent methyltransferase [Kordiimonadaceae bacterium]|nr:class I SAM-dependent methyltransferase [Kordiimonadaceae bacterium]
MRLNQAQVIEKVFKAYDCRDALELGFFHGVSTVYMASILKSMGDRRTLTTIDLLSAKERSPNLDELAAKFGVSDHVEAFYEPRSYLWRLKAFIEEGRKFDFCYLDGGHTWADSGFAFFLIDKLLKKDGVILFDDMKWTPEHQPAAQHWPEDERTTAAVERVWTLLVMQHPNYDRVWTHGNWALAQKRDNTPLVGGAKRIWRKLIGANKYINFRPDR